MKRGSSTLKHLRLIFYRFLKTAYLAVCRWPHANTLGISLPVKLIFFVVGIKHSQLKEENQKVQVAIKQ